MSYIPDLEEDTEEFRDTIATVDKYGKRIWLYPKKPSGRFYNARTWVSFAFLAIFLTLPFIKIDGEQIFLFNDNVCCYLLLCPNTIVVKITHPSLKRFFAGDV